MSVSWGLASPLFWLLILLFSSLANFYFSIQILRRVRAEETKLSFFEIRWQVHKHMRTYCRLSRLDEGRIGRSFYGYWGSLLLMLAALVLLLTSIGA